MTDSPDDVPPAGTYDEPFEVEKVVGKIIEGGEIYYRVKWTGWDESTNTWEPLEHLKDCMEVLDEYEESVAQQRKVSTPSRRTKRRKGRKAKSNNNELMKDRPGPKRSKRFYADTDYQPSSSDKRSTRQSPNNTVEVIIEDDEYAVERIVEKRTEKNGKAFYHVKWLGYDEAENSWEPASSFKKCPHVIEEFEKSLSERQDRKKSNDQSSSSGSKKEDRSTRR